MKKIKYLRFLRFLTDRRWIPAFLVGKRMWGRDYSHQARFS